MGLLVGLAAAVQIARLNAAVSSLGTREELNVIAAAVIGGTSLAGGVGTIVGALLGALVMQSLVSGMVLMGIEAPLQDIVVGIVLVVAVTLSTRSSADGPHDDRPIRHPARRATQHPRRLRGRARGPTVVTVDLYPGRWSAWWAATARARPP